MPPLPLISNQASLCLCDEDRACIFFSGFSSLDFRCCWLHSRLLHRLPLSTYYSASFLLLPSVAWFLCLLIPRSIHAIEFVIIFEYTCAEEKKYLLGPSACPMRLSVPWIRSSLLPFHTLFLLCSNDFSSPAWILWISTHFPANQRSSLAFLISSLASSYKPASCNEQVSFPSIPQSRIRHSPPREKKNITTTTSNPSSTHRQHRRHHLDNWHSRSLQDTTRARKASYTRTPRYETSPSHSIPSHSIQYPKDD